MREEDGEREEGREKCCRSKKRQWRRRKRPRGEREEVRRRWRGKFGSAKKKIRGIGRAGWGEGREAFERKRGREGGAVKLDTRDKA